jgi:methyl-accepting chemotaxis protein
MSIRKKILAISIGPVLVLGVITLLFMLTMVKSSLMDEVQDALKGTAAATEKREIL